MLLGLFVGRMLLAPAAIFGQLDAGLQLLVFAGIITDALADGAFHFDQIILTHRVLSNDRYSSAK